MSQKIVKRDHRGVSILSFHEKSFQFFTINRVIIVEERGKGEANRQSAIRNSDEKTHSQPDLVFCAYIFDRTVST